MWKWEKKGVREGEIKERKISNDMLSSVSRSFFCIGLKHIYRLSGLSVPNVQRFLDYFSGICV